MNGHRVPSKIHACVVGVGRLGTFHARKYQELAGEGVALAALVDMDPEKARAAFPGIPVFPDVKALLAAEARGDIPKLDLASVATTTNAHREASIALLKAGKHVLVEKPLAMSSGEGREIVRAATAAQRVLAVGHVERHRAMDMLRRLERPRFIECHRLAPFSNRSTDIDVVLDLMIHDIDLMLAIVKSPLKLVHAAGFPVLTDKIDIANVRFEFQDGCIANLTSSRISVAATRKFRVFSGDTYVSLDLAAGTYQHFHKRPGVANLEDAIEGDMGEIEVKDALRTEVGDFVKAVTSGGRPLVTGEEALEAQVLAEKVLEQILERVGAETGAR